MPLSRYPLLLPLFLTLLVQGIIAMAMFALPVLLPAYAVELGVGAPFAGVATATIYGGAAVTAMLLSSRIRRIGPILMCQIALFCAGAGVCLAAAGNQTALIAGALAIGLGYGPVTSASALLLTQNTPPKAYGLVFSINRVSIPLGAAIAGATFPLLSSAIGWQESLVGAGIMCLGGVVLLQSARGLDIGYQQSTQKESPSSMFTPIRDLFIHPKRRILTQASLVFLAAQSCLAAFTVAMLVGDLAVAYVEAGSILAAAQMSGVVARLLMGYASDRMKSRLTVIGTLGLLITIATALVAVSSAGWHLRVILAIFMLYGAGALGWNGVLLAELAQTASPEKSGEVAGASSAVAFVGAVAGPALVSALVAFTSYSGAFALLSLTVFVLSVKLIRFEIQDQAARSIRQ